MDWQSALAWRARRHGLDERRGDLLDVAGSLCGLHAQLMSSAELTAWARVDGLAREAVAQALWDERTLVKTWAMRGTLHLVPASDLGLFHGALSTYAYFLKPAWSRASGVTPAELERLIEAVATALDGRQLTREELAAEVARETGSAELGEKLRESWGALLKPAAFRGRLCFAPNDGQRVRFTFPDTWVGELERVESEAALEEIARRWLWAYGPGRREDFARWWFGTSPAQSQKLLERLGDEVAVVEVDGERCYAPAAALDEIAGASLERSVRLLPSFDQFVVGCARELAGEHRDRIYRQQGWISPVLLVNGRMAGVWRHERKGARLEVDVESFAKQPAWARAGVKEEAERLAAFLGGDLVLR